MHLTFLKVSFGCQSLVLLRRLFKLISIPDVLIEFENIQSLLYSVSGAKQKIILKKSQQGVGGTELCCVRYSSYCTAIVHFWCMNEVIHMIHVRYWRLKVSCDLACRYLYRHNYTLSLPEMYYQINRPDTQSFYVSTLQAYGDTVSGSDENWVNYLKDCKRLSSKFWLKAQHLLHNY